MEPLAVRGDPLSEAGARVAHSPDEAVRDASIVITMLPTADVVNAVIFDGNVAEAFAQGAVWAQMGTIGLAATTEIAGKLRKLRPDVLFVDAPVSAARARPRPASCSSWPPARLRRIRSLTGCSPQSAARPCGSVRPARAAG